MNDSYPIIEHSLQTVLEMLNDLRSAGKQTLITIQGGLGEGKSTIANALSISMGDCVLFNYKNPLKASTIPDDKIIIVDDADLLNSELKELIELKSNEGCMFICMVREAKLRGESLDYCSLVKSGSTLFTSRGDGVVSVFKA